MTIVVHFYSYFAELTGCKETHLEVADACDISQLLEAAFLRFPNLRGLENSTLIAVGLDYQPKSYLLKKDDQVSLFPPVQGG